jgi:rRNA maturation protein Nop10
MKAPQQNICPKCGGRQREVGFYAHPQDRTRCIVMLVCIACGEHTKTTAPMR